MKLLLPSLLTLLIGTIVVVNGVGIKTEDILDNAQYAADQLNRHQLATVLEIYYLDNNKYPSASDGTELINILENGNYIKSRPHDPDVFEYKTLKDGQDFTLKISN